jgi:hypothetical protein
MYEMRVREYGEWMEWEPISDLDSLVAISGIEFREMPEFEPGYYLLVKSIDGKSALTGDKEHFVIWRDEPCSGMRNGAEYVKVRVFARDGGEI